jgi:hypothetical protein
LIHLARFAFAWLPTSCRYEPPVRHAEQAIERYGLPAARGWALVGSLPPPATPAGSTPSDERVRRVPRSGRRDGPFLVIAMARWLVGRLPGPQLAAPGSRPTTPTPRRHPAAPRPRPTVQLPVLAVHADLPGLLLTLVVLDRLTGNIAIAIIPDDLIKVPLIPVFRRQLVSTRRMQQIAPELKEIQRRFKGDRMKVQQATAQLYKERGVSPLGCLPIVLQMFLLIPLYSVFSQGLQNFNIQQMLDVFGFRSSTSFAWPSDLRPNNTS